MKSTPGTWPDSVMRMLKLRSEYDGRYEVGTYLVDDEATHDPQAWWAARVAGTVEPEESLMFDGPWMIALFEAYESFGAMIEEITADEMSVAQQVKSDVATGLDLIWDQVDAMVGTAVDLETDNGWCVKIPTLHDRPVAAYLFRIH